MLTTPLATLFWDPDPVFIQLPLIGRPLVWYGLLFAVGFLISYLFMKRLVLQRFAEKEIQKFKKVTNLYADRLLWATVIGTLVGARLGHILFYDLSYYLANPGEIIKIWHGGLASHGGGVGILLALIVFYQTFGRRYPIRFFRLLDVLVVPTPIACAFIRFGNFINQEILGTASSMPWAVTFGHPADGSLPEPRHPVQLYEGFAYLLIFGLLWTLYRKLKDREGLSAGLFFSAMMAVRFALEMFKEPYTWGTLNTGQWLSFPFLLGGIVLSVWAARRKREVAA